MQPMMDYNIALLGAVSDFLSHEPVIYLFGTVIFLLVIKGFKMLVS